MQGYGVRGDPFSGVRASGARPGVSEGSAVVIAASIASRTVYGKARVALFARAGGEADRDARGGGVEHADGVVDAHPRSPDLRDARDQPS